MYHQIILLLLVITPVVIYLRIILAYLICTFDNIEVNIDFVFTGST